MKIPRYWARRQQVARRPDGWPFDVICWHWSNTSPEEAEERVAERARSIARAVEAGAPLNRYAYSDRPLREEIVDSIADDAGAEAALVTRNSYGALVLNTANAMFIDIDFPEPTPGGLLGGLFGKRPPDPQAAAVQKISAWVDQSRGVSMRVYRTFAGLRCLITSHVFDPTERQSVDLLQQLGADPLYVRLCKAQECFRARLTPKPWRCGVRQPPSVYPWQNAEIERRYRDWQRAYEQASAGYAVCTLVAELGRREIHPAVDPILSLHDRATGLGSGRPLA